MNIRNFCIRTLLVVGLSLVFILSPSVSAAKWYKDYDEAKEAAKREDWTAAIEFLKQAIEKEPDPEERKRTYGMHFIEYYPYLKLGQAYLEIGDREAALQACEKAEKEGVAPEEDVKKCLSLATPIAAPTKTSLSKKEKQQKLTELLQQKRIQPEHFERAFKMLDSDKSNPLLEGLLSGKISPEHFNCAFPMLESEKFNPLLEGLLSGKISPEVFNRAFTCESQ